MNNDHTIIPLSMVYHVDCGDSRLELSVNVIVFHAAMFK